ncbi:MAG: WxL domain-containing protein [Carnobacterium sp.]|uniref:WxL domain-containing protein n=1 Tax=Carnobacterium sp. TaxID=48221 RepID=UPI002FCAB1E9
MRKVTAETSSMKTVVNSGLGKEELIDPEVKPATENTGDLTIDAVSFISFGAIKIGEPSKVAQVPQGEKLGIQIRDVRGTGEGWSLNVKMSPFKSPQHPDKSITPLLELPEGTLKNGINDNFRGPTNFLVQVNQTFQPLLVAETNQGMGQWLLLFENKSSKVRLTNIPSDSLSGDYTADIDWQLVNGPR